jgi:hypothetical protein
VEEEASIVVVGVTAAGAILRRPDLPDQFACS